MKDVRGGDINKFRLGVPEKQKDNFIHVRYLFIFYFFPPNIKFIYFVWYWPKWIQFGQSAQFGRGLDIYEWKWIGVKIQLCPKLGEEVLRGQKHKICSAFS